MALANREATSLNHPSLEPAHLMLGLIAEDMCVAMETLRVLDVDLEAVRDGVRSKMAAAGPNATIGRRAHGEKLREVMQLAIEEARKFSHRYVGTEHLLLGLLAHGDSIPGQVLRDQGLDLDQLREKILALLHSSVTESHDLSHSRHGDFEWAHQQELSKAFRSPSFWHTLILAVDTANRTGAGEIEPPHVLMALLRDSSNGLADVLAEKGVTADWLRERLIQLDK
jgi:ATP-dependent Clp protease ATP-binding subunit ClpA